MKYFLLFLTVLCALSIIHLEAAADRTLKCGTYLVSVGDTTAEVLEKCGEPDRIERREEGKNTWTSQLYDYKEERYKAPKLIKGPIRMDIWTYDLGSNRFVRYLHFQNDELINIETGEKGRE